MTALLDSEISASDLAALAGVTDRRIRQLTQEGKLSRSSRNKYKLGDAVRVLIGLAADASDSTEMQREKLRKLRADANLAELEFSTAKGLVAPVEQMERIWQRTCATIRAKMLQLPQRAAIALLGETSETRFKAVLSDEIKQALNSAAQQVPEELTDDTDD